MKSRNIVCSLTRIIGACFICFLILSGCSSNETNRNSKIVTTGSGSYPEFTLSQLVNQSAAIVRGEVVSRGVPFEKVIDSQSAEKLILVYTPITIKVKEWIKGDNAQDEIVFNEPGGETNDRVMIVEDYKLQVSDEVIIFLNPVGVSWGEQGVYHVLKDRTIGVCAHLVPDLAEENKANEPYVFIGPEVLTDRIKEEINKS